MAEPDRTTMLAWTYMPSYGSMDWQQLTEAVSEARVGDRTNPLPLDPASHIGHQMVPEINFNSLNRIVTAFVNAAKSAPAPDQTNAEVSDERLREIIDGCEGVTPGPWVWLDLGEVAISDAEPPDDTLIEVADEALGEHIARLDPATVKALATELLARRTQPSAGEPVAWQHPTAGWVSTDYKQVWAHCQTAGPAPIPLYATPPDQSRVESLEAPPFEVMTSENVEMWARGLGFAEFHPSIRKLAMEVEFYRARQALHGDRS